MLQWYWMGAAIQTLQVNLPSISHVLRAKNVSGIHADQTFVVDDDADILNFVSGCKFLFLDVGSNRGTHIRKLFEPHLYETAPYLKIFDGMFGNASFRSQPSSVTGLCAIGIEPNPRWAQRFTQIEKAYHTMGWKVKWLRKGVSNCTTNITFWGDAAGKSSDVGFSTSHKDSKKIKTVWVPVSVQTVVFAELLEKIHLTIPDSKKLIKMDVEGSEYEVLEQMLEKQLLCKTRIDKMSIEWHLNKLMGEYNVKFDQKTVERYRHIEQKLGNGGSCSEGEATEVTGLDDESFFMDGRPLPAGPMNTVGSTIDKNANDEQTTTTVSPGIHADQTFVVDDDADILNFVSGCKFLFLDVGSNRGTHIRKLFEPHLYETAPYLKIFDGMFGNASFRSQPSSVTGLCAIGIEPNPRWAQRFTQIEKAYHTMGWKVKWLRKGVSNCTTNITFWGDAAGKSSDVGFSTSHKDSKKIKTVWVPVSVQTVVFAELLEKIHLTIPDSKKLIKMDVEGSEYEVLEQMLEKQLLCKTRIDKMSIEWHLNKLMGEYNVKFDPKTVERYRHIEQKLGNGGSCSEGEATEVTGLDDESFFMDGRPLPDQWVLNKCQKAPVHDVHNLKMC